MVPSRYAEFSGITIQVDGEVIGTIKPHNPENADPVKFWGEEIEVGIGSPPWEPSLTAEEASLLLSSQLDMWGFWMDEFNTRQIPVECVYEVISFMMTLGYYAATQSTCKEGELSIKPHDFHFKLVQRDSKEPA